jgi:hypothetical protein
MLAYFLDFDGVIVDSINECYSTSFASYQHIYGALPNIEHSNIRRLFFKHRGLVRPVDQFLALYKSIIDCVNIESSIPLAFKQYINQIPTNEKKQFEETFFNIRKNDQADISKWLGIHSITEFGEVLKIQADKMIYILTTKDTYSVKLLLDHFNLPSYKIMGVDEYRKYGNKGLIIEHLLATYPEISKGVFVDDAIEHLDTVNNNKIECYFSDWGYGLNTNYPLYNKDIWFSQ